MRFLRLQIGLLVVPADAGKSRVCWSNAGSDLEIVSYIMSHVPSLMTSSGNEPGTPKMSRASIHLHRAIA